MKKHNYKKGGYFKSLVHVSEQLRTIGSIHKILEVDDDNIAYEGLDRHARHTKCYDEIEPYYPNETKRTLTRENYKKLYSIACGGWKGTLQNKFGKDFALNDTVDIEEEFYKKMRNAADTDQHKVLDEIFGKDEEEFFKVGDWVTDGERKYIISSKHSLTGSREIFLVNLKAGVWHRGRIVDNPKRITQKELRVICCSDTPLVKINKTIM